VIDDDEEPPASPAQPRRSFWRELPVMLVVAVVVAVVVRAFILQTFWIPSQSMENTLLINDRVLVNKLVYVYRSPHRGEIAVFEPPPAWRSSADEDDIIKRVIGEPGDHIVCCDDRQRLVVNDHPLDEPYIYTAADGTADQASRETFDIVVPKGRYWMMGDHRSDSADSREHYVRDGDLVAATIPEDAMVGRAFAIFWPFGRARWLGVPDSFDKVPDP
jgi:signal peptidase I